MQTDTTVLVMHLYLVFRQGLLISEIFNRVDQFVTELVRVIRLLGEPSAHHIDVQVFKANRRLVVYLAKD